MSPVRDESKPYDIPHNRILRNHGIKSVAPFRHSEAWLLCHSQPTVETGGYGRSSLTGL